MVVSKLARAVTKWTQVCDRRKARLISYIHNTQDLRQYCHVSNTVQGLSIGLSDFVGEIAPCGVVTHSPTLPSQHRQCAACCYCQAPLPGRHLCAFSVIWLYFVEGPSQLGGTSHLMDLTLSTTTNVAKPINAVSAL